MGGHCVKTWSATQGAVALSSAEAGFYAMVDAVERAKWLVTVAKEFGFEGVAGQMVLGTDNSAAEGFVSRRGLGKMRHIEVRELWLQHEVLKGVVKVVKILGEQNPADLMTKCLNRSDIASRLAHLDLHATEGNPVKADRVAVGQEEEEDMQSRKLVRGRWADAGGEEGGEAEVQDWWREVQEK